MTETLLSDIADRCSAAEMAVRPKYLRLMNAFQDAIADGTLAPGDRLPTETEIVAGLPFALGTVQKALNGLVAQGILRRSRRSGTFVAARVRPLDDMSHYSFERPDGANADVLTRVVDCAIVHEDGRWRRVLGDCNDGYVRIVRIDEVDGSLACYGEIHLRADAYAALVDRPLARLAGLNIRTLLTRHFGAVTRRLSFATRATRMPLRSKETLGVARMGSCLELEVTGYDAADSVLFLQTLYVPPGDFRLRLHRTD